MSSCCTGEGALGVVAQFFTFLLPTTARVLYMSFDKFLLAVESRDLSQADKSIIIVSSFPKLFLNDKIYSYTKKNNYLALGNLAKLMFWSILSFKNLQD